MTTLPQQSLAAVTTAPNVMEIRRLEIPDIGDDEAIVRIEATGICGTDYEWFRGDLDIPYPIILGHEPLGRIAAIGSQASERWGVGIGDRVAVRSGYRCGRCAACEAGGTEPCPTAAGFSQTGLDKSPGLWGVMMAFRPTTSSGRRSRCVGCWELNIPHFAAPWTRSTRANTRWNACIHTAFPIEQAEHALATLSGEAGVPSIHVAIVPGS